MTPYIAILSGGTAAQLSDHDIAHAVGRRLAAKKAIVVTAGRGGVLEQVLSSAASAGATTLQIVSPGGETDPHAGLVVRTPSDASKRNVLVETCDGAIVIGGRLGTLVVVAQFLAAHKPVVAIRNSGGVAASYSDRDVLSEEASAVHGADGPEDAVDTLLRLLMQGQPVMD